MAVKAVMADLETAVVEAEKAKTAEEVAKNALDKAKKRHAILDGVRAYPVVDAEDILKFLDSGKIVVNKQGDVTGLREQMEELQKTKPHLFTLGIGGQGSRGGFNPRVDSGVGVVDHRKLSWADAYLAGKQIKNI
ncbi:MAG: hypothetical protein DDT34_02314 [Firmicutes bacterium]|nr:hypothetical protein [Bacillota bacterium]